MPRPTMPRRNDPYADLDIDFKDAVSGEAPEKIRQRIAEVALNEAANLKAKEDDEDLADKKEAAKLAGESYSEATKMNRLKIKFMRRVLIDKGNITDIS